MFKAFWEKVRLSLSVWLNANKIVLKAMQLHWIPALLLVIVSAALLIYAFACPDANPVIAYAGYFISAYTLAVVCFRMPKIFKALKKSLYSNAYSKKIITDKKLRTEFFMYFSCGFSIIYAIIKFSAGVYYHSLWIGAVAVYYIIVSLMRFGLIKQYRNNLKRENDREQRILALKSYRFCGVLMFVLNIAVSGLVVQLIWHGETYQYPGFLIYAFAAYSFTVLEWRYGIWQSIGSWKHRYWQRQRCCPLPVPSCLYWQPRRQC